MENTPEQTAEGTAVVRVLATVLERLVKTNSSTNSNAPAGDGQVTKFHALKAPGISILQYLERIHKYSSCSTECFILALIYIDRLIQSNNFLLNELNVHRVVITAVLLAAKFFDDAYYNNAYYAKVGGVLVTEMNGLEVEFLFRINFSLHVTPEIFAKYQAELVSHACCGGTSGGTGNDKENTEATNTITGIQHDHQAQPPSSNQLISPQGTSHNTSTVGAQQPKGIGIAINATGFSSANGNNNFERPNPQTQQAQTATTQPCVEQQMDYKPHVQPPTMPTHQEHAIPIPRNQHFNRNNTTTMQSNESQQQRNTEMYIPQRHITPSPPQTQQRRSIPSQNISSYQTTAPSTTQNQQTYSHQYYYQQQHSAPGATSTSSGTLNSRLIRHHSYPTNGDSVSDANHMNFEQQQQTITTTQVHHQQQQYGSEPPLFTAFGQFPEMTACGHTSISTNTAASSPHYINPNW